MGTALNYDREIIDCIIDILRKWICTLNDLDMRMNETFPMTTSGEIARSDKWLSIKPMNFIFTFMSRSTSFNILLTNGNINAKI